MPRSPRSAPVPAPPREALSPARIAQAALELIDLDGLAALSMRKIGQRLGVEAMALYHHVDSKGRLLDQVMDLLVQEVEVPPPGSMPALQRMRHTLLSYRHLAIVHPHAFALLVGRRFNSDGAFAFYEQVLQILAELQLSPAQAARWFRTLGYFVSGAGMADIASRERQPDATALTLQRAPATVRFPHVAAVAPHLTVDRLDDVFEFGMQQMLTALAAESAAQCAAAARRAGVSSGRRPR